MERLISKSSYRQFRRIKSLIILVFSFVFTLGMNNSVYGETLVEDTILQIGTYSYNTDLVVPAGVSLTIEAGASLIFGSNNKLEVEADGKLFIQGTTATPVILTGDLPVKSHWLGIEVNGTRTDFNDVIIEHAIVEFSKYAVKLNANSKVVITYSQLHDNGNGVRINGGDAKISNSELYNNSSGIYFEGANAKGIVTSNRIYDNNYGVYIDAKKTFLADHPTPIINYNSFDNIYYNYYAKEFYDAAKRQLDATHNWWGTIDLSIIPTKIYDYNDNKNLSPTVDFSQSLLAEGGEPTTDVQYITPILTDTMWTDSNATLVQDIHILSGASLTIIAGAKVTALSGTRLIIEDGGKLFIQGSTDNPVVMTGSSPIENGWQGVQIKGTRTDFNDIVINHAVFEYAYEALILETEVKASVANSQFNGNRYAIKVNSSELQLTESTFINNRTGIIFTGEGATGNVTNNRIYDNLYGLAVIGSNTYVAEQPTPIVNQNSIYNNSEYNYYSWGYYDASKIPLNANNNWWGTADLSIIATKIYDNNDNPSLSPVVNFSQSLLAEDGEPSTDVQYITPIIADTTWTDNNATLVQDIHILSGASLTIIAGAKITALSGTRLIVEDGGKLFIQGTVDNPVVLTGSSPNENGWKGLQVKGARTDFNDIVINHAIFEYAYEALILETEVKASVANSQFNDNRYAIKVNSGEIQLTDSTFFNNRTGVAFSGTGATGNVTNNRIYDNLYGLSVIGSNTYVAEQPMPVVNQNSIFNNSEYNYYSWGFYDEGKRPLDARNNWWGTTDISIILTKIYDHYDNKNLSPVVDFSQSLLADGGEPSAGTQYLGSIANETRWQSSEGLVLATTTVLAGGHLIIEAGSNLKFAKDSQLIVNKNAKLTIVGDRQKPITLTSNEISPSAGDWQGILIKDENDAVNISHATIEYADKAIAFSGKKSTGQVLQNKIQHNNYGVYVNGYNLAFNDHPTPHVTNNSFIDNKNYHYVSYAFGNASSRILNARGNYWGTLDMALVEQKIYDNNDASSSTIVDFDFSRTSEVFNVEVDAGADSITFATLNTELTGTVISNLPVVNTQWQQYLGDLVTLNNANLKLANFTVPNIDSEQLLSFSLTITDENQISATDNLTVVVKPLVDYNLAPDVAESQELLITGGDEVVVTLTASDSDNDPLTYTWQQVSGDNITLSNTSTDSLVFTAPQNVKNKLYLFKLTVADGYYEVERNVQVAVTATVNTAGIYYYHNDYLGTPQVMTNSDATVVWQAHYTPFGQTDVVVETVTNNIRFQGQYYDQESGLHYNYFRDYDPELGRYIQSDPIGLAGGINTYGYAYQNPVMNYDPDGRLILNLLSGGVGAILSGYSAYKKGGDFGDIASASIIGGVINAFSGKALFNAVVSVAGNLSSQVTNPCFNDDIDYFQATVAGLLGAYNLGSRLPQPNLLSAKSIAAHSAGTQTLNNTIISLF